jgi:hypothetical protein
VALTDDGTELTEAHRIGQLTVRARLVQELAAIWPLFNIEDIAGSWTQFESVAMPAIARSNGTSAGLASSYFTEFRRTEGIQGRFVPRIAGDTNVEALRIAVPAQAGRAVSLGRRDAATVAFTNLVGEATRQALNGGRSTIDLGVQEDRQAIGWIRVTDGNPCAFCAMLASRGPAYKSRQSTTSGEVWSQRVGGYRAHAHCGCQAEPVYSTRTTWPGRGREFEALWQSTTKGLSGKDALNAFRRSLT